MLIRTTTREVSIGLGLWTEDIDNVGWQDGGFDELEDVLPRDCERDDEGYLLATDEEVDELIAWWQNQVDKSNSGYYGEEYLGRSDMPLVMTDEQRESGREWRLFVDITPLTQD